MQIRIASKTTDKLNICLEAIKNLKFKKLILSWDRLEDPVEGIVVVPILEIDR